MKILVIWPPQIPSYFNAGHHLPVFITAEHLRRTIPGAVVETMDAGSLSVTWKEIGERLYQFQPDLVCVINDFDNVDNLDRLIVYCRELAVGGKIVTAGRLGVQVPRVMRQFDLDAVVVSGDFEAGVQAYAEHLIRPSLAQLPGVATRDGDNWIDAAPGRTLSPNEWAMPDVREIPYESYDRMYSRDQNKFCGIPQRRELVVPAGRGCPINCSFCDVPSVQGLRDRRLSVEDAIAYIQSAQSMQPFDYVSFYAPTFTFDRKWIVSFCEQYAQLQDRLPWKCATAIPYLDRELIQAMAGAGCIRISVGLETLEPEGLLELPRKKRTEVLRFDELNNFAAEVNVEMNFFVMVGLPGTSQVGTRATFDAITEAGARARPTVYSSMDDLRASTSKDALWRFNRQLLGVPADGSDTHELYQHFFGAETRVTAVMDQIPSRANVAAGVGA